MSIEVICPDCSTAHKVKGEAAGKKLRCKGCQKVIPIPVPSNEDGDPWDDLDENEGGEELPPVTRQAPATGRKSGKRGKSKSGGGMPIPILVSIGFNGVTIAVYGIMMLINLIAGEYYGPVTGLIRIAIDSSIIQGLIGRKKRTWWLAIILDAIGFGATLLCVMPLILLAANQPDSSAGNVFNPAESTIHIVALVLQVVLWLADFVLLLTRPAKEWCSE